MITLPLWVVLITLPVGVLGVLLLVFLLSTIVFLKIPPSKNAEEY